MSKVSKVSKIKISDGKLISKSSNLYEINIETVNNSFRNRLLDCFYYLPLAVVTISLTIVELFDPTLGTLEEGVVIVIFTIPFEF